MKLSQNLFELSEEDIETSKMMYNKVIKCLVVPYHTQKQLELDYSPNVFMFPENEMTESQAKKFISMVTNSPLQEFLIITKSSNIIYDMVDCCVRILTENNVIITCPVKTFAANLWDISLLILNNNEHQITEAEKSKSHIMIGDIITKIENATSFTDEEADELSKTVDIIGDEIISYRLKEMLNEKRQTGFRKR